MADILTDTIISTGSELYGGVEAVAPSLSRTNCWEFKKCGREPGGAKVAELGICPAASEAMFDGVFGGRNSGRACWVVAGTFCKGEVQGTFAQKFKNCARCEFFKRVQEEEGENFHPVNVLLSYIDRTHEQRVDERTQELREAKESVEAANAKLEETNKKLEKANHIASLDMAMASRLQASFFPKTPPKSGAWDSAFVFKPLSGVSGDFYDFYVKDRELRGASLFDVSGHGIAPGLLTLLARSIVHQQFHAGEKRKLGGIIEHANRVLVKELDAIENYITGIVLRFTGDRVEYVNAGHTDLLLRRSASGKVIRVEPPGIDFRGHFLGKAGLESKFTTVLFRMQKGDFLLLYSDCLEESRNASGEEYGAARIARSLSTIPDGLTATEIADRVLADFFGWVARDRVKDDLTVLVIRRTADERHESDYAI